MSYQCRYCEKSTEKANTITIYDQDGVEQRLETLCPECYEDWLQSLRG